MKRNNGIIGPVQTTSTTGGNYSQGYADGIFDLHDVHTKRLDDKWPRAHLYVSLTPSTTTVTEGNSMTFTLVTEHIPNDTTIYYTIITVSGTNMSNADFFASPNDGGIQGTFTTTGDSTVLTFGLTAEQSPGDAESNVFKLRINGPAGYGPTFIESADITVTDAIALGTDIYTSFYEISNRVIYISGVNDYSGAYDVGEIQQAYSGSARIYIALKCTASTTYYNDICIAAVQVLNSSNVVQQTWNFSSSSNNSWQTTTSQITGSSSLLSSYLTPSQAAAYSYSTMSTTNNINRIGIATSTGSYTTGMADGITNSTTTAYSVGNSQVSQASGAYYFYREVSGATRYSHAVARSPSYTFSSGDKIRVVHAVTAPFGYGVLSTDSIWIGVQ